jgi:hypothetical protein
VRHALVLLSLTFATACNCGSTLVTGGPCTHDSDCTAGHVCKSGHCTVGDGGTGGGSGGGTGGGADAGPCVTDCGSGCCTANEVCELNACHLKCAMGTSRCGDAPMEACCTSAQVCYLSACTTPGAACSLSMPCPMGQLCDPTLGHCLPRGPAGACEFHPDGGAVNPSTLWDFIPPDPYTQVMMTPAVVDVNGDGVPDVLANYFTIATGYGGNGIMRALSGDDGHVLWATADDASSWVHPPASLAIADLTGTGELQAITVDVAGELISFDAKTGTKLWTSHDAMGGAVTCAADWGGPSVADLDGDGFAEIICGFEVFDPTGLLKWNHGLGNGGVGPLSIAVDLDGDGKLEVTDGASAYRFDGSAFGWTGTGAAGFPATGDFVDGTGAPGRDGNPEIVVVAGGSIVLVNGQTGVPLTPAALIPSWDGTSCMQMQGGMAGSGGPPTVADFDGDGQPEVGVAALQCYSEYKLTGSGATLAWSVVWSNKTQDQSSSVTGSSVFDFNGDGRAEVVYADEIAVHVYDGRSGTEIFNRPHCSGTTYEYPLIVDVNGNGRADIIVPENTYAASGLNCDPSVQPGIHVFHDALDQWVNTRRVWNQHAYDVTNVCDGLDLVCGGPGAAGNTLGRVPLHQPKNWTFANSTAAGAPPLNNFRQNVQGEGLFDAPDLAIKDPAFLGCPGPFTVSARVVNQGALGVLAGLKVAFYLDGMPRTLIGVASTTHALLPGDSEVVSVMFTPPMGSMGPWSIIIVADDDGTGAGTSSECNEMNNASTLPIACITIN